MTRKVFILATLLVGTFALANSASAQTDPSELSFKRVRANKNVTFKASDGCGLLTDDDSNTVSKITIVNSGTRVRLPASYKLKSKKLPTKYNWFACGTVNNQVGLYARKKQTSTPVEISLNFEDFDAKPQNQGISCSKNRPIRDGNGGWLHKPVSDNTGSMVDLFPAELSPKSCVWYSKAGKKITGTYGYNRSNPNRVTVRPSNNKRCSSFPNNITLRCKVSNQNWCWKIPNPCTRYD
ncbi:MAG: hypothetical protein KDD56_00660 [Bdellovibrionales bacterium]|nr:hypothetical protein [Bdellovibrionales bacterium]